FVAFTPLLSRIYTLQGTFWIISFVFTLKKLKTKGGIMKKIIPNLWFDKQAEEAAHFYTSVFKNSKIGRISRYDKASSEVSGMPEGEVMTIEFELDGQQ